MRTLGIVLAAGALVAASGAQAQQQNFFGRDKGNQSQQANGYSEIKKQEEKKFPIGASWIAVSFNGKPYGGSERPAFSLDDQFRVKGFGGCNSFATSAFPMRSQGFAVGPLAITKRNCDKGLMESEMAFFTALRTAAKWDSKVGSLIISGPNGEIRFERSL